MEHTVIVTGGAGFIGSAVVHLLLSATNWRIVNIDKLTYSGNLASLADVENHPRYHFIQADVADAAAMRAAFEVFQPTCVMHLAAESHVDRSIDGPAAFMQTNIIGTFTLLEEARRHWKALGQSAPDKAALFRFHHISTDEVFGDLADSGDLFTEQTPYAPSSPYSASKASSDHLVRAWHRTYGLPVLITNCSNNYGPRQFPEKLIPLMILNALAGRSLPVYGDGRQIRDWLHVEDHARALLQVLACGQVGETYNIGGFNEWKNIDLIRVVINTVDRLLGRREGEDIDLITYVTDRAGHDMRYAIDSTKLQKELGWEPSLQFEEGIEKTVRWYLDNQEWMDNITSGDYEKYYEEMYAKR